MRGFDQVSPSQLCEICKDLKRATNLPKGAQFFHAVEKYLKNEIKQGRPWTTDFQQLSAVAQPLL